MVTLSFSGTGAADSLPSPRAVDHSGPASVSSWIATSGSARAHTTQQQRQPPRRRTQPAPLTTDNRSAAIVTPAVEQRKLHGEQPWAFWCSRSSDTKQGEISPKRTPLECACGRPRPGSRSCSPQRGSQNRPNDDIPPVRLPAWESRTLTDRAGPVEQAIRDRGISDPVILLRAAAIDNAAWHLITRAENATSVPNGSLLTL